MANAIITRLTNKVGPLPAWAWAAIPATAYVAWSYYRASQGDSVISDDPAAVDEDTYEYGLNTGGASLPGYGTMPGGSSNLPAVDPPKPTNIDWFRRASSFLLGKNYSATDAVTALNAYIYGSPATITAVQKRALNEAIAALGPAPDPAFIPGETPAPTPTPKPTPTPTPKPSPVKPKAPAAVGSLRLSSPSTNRLIATWSAPAGRVTRYKWILYSGTSGVRNGETIATTAEIAVPGGKIYSIRVWAINEVGTSPMAVASAKAK